MERESRLSDFYFAMMKRNHTRLCGGAAIAAALTLTSIPALAQMAPAAETPAAQPVPTFPEATPPAPIAVEAQPSVVLPTTLPEIAPEPTVAAPEPTLTAPEPTVAAPEQIVEPAPVAAEPAPATTRTERVAPRAAPPMPATNETDGAPSEPQPAAIDAEPTALPADTVAEPLAVAAPVTAPVEAAPSTAPSAVNDNNTQFWVAVLAGLIAVALAIWGFVAIGRRKTVQRRVAAVERPVVAPRPPAAQPDVLGTPTVTPLATARPRAATPSLAHSGAAVALPSRMPATFAERDALLKRMIAAKPDRANPFTTPKARLKRARLILQSLGRDFGGQEPWIDLSQYPSNWPEAANRKTAAA